MNTSDHTPWRSYTAHAIFEADAAFLWPHVADFGGLAVKIPDQLTSCDLVGHGVGAVRTLTLKNGKTARETLISLHPELFRLAYAMQDPSPFPWTRYFCTQQLQALGAGQTHFLIAGFYHPAGGDPAAVKTILEGVYRGLFEGIARIMKVRIAIRPEE
jgi:hypothetical protein